MRTWRHWQRAGMEYQKFHLGRAVELAMGARVGEGGECHVPVRNRARTATDV